MPHAAQTIDEEKTLTDVLALAQQTRPENGTAFTAFLSQIVRLASGEDQYWANPTTLLELAHEAWTTASIRAPQEHLIHLRHENRGAEGEQRLVLDLISEDRPFLVTSISGALSDAGKSISFFTNAVVDITRDEEGKRVKSSGNFVREAIIHAEMDPALGDEEVEEIRQIILTVMADLSIAVADWEPMRARLGSCIAQLERARPEGVDRSDQKETVDFLKWLWDNRFAFIGVRRYQYVDEGNQTLFEHQTDQDLGIMRDSTRQVMKGAFIVDGTPSPAALAFRNSNEPVLVAKTNAKSHIHRRVYMDYIAVKSYDRTGRATGEEHFIGLFTQDAYNRPASDIPLLHAKMTKVLDHAAFAAGGHNENALINILETFPRDEMFQIDVDSLRDTAMGILRMYKRPRVKLYLRRDRFDRFVSALVFVPRDQFNSDIRNRIGNYLASCYDGRLSAYYPSFGDVSLVRVQYIIGLDEGAPLGPSLAEMTAQIRDICRDWKDDLRAALRASKTLGQQLHNIYGDAFDGAYRARNDAQEAIKDIAALEKFEDQLLMPRVYRRADDEASTVRIKLYSKQGPQKLSSLIPTFENLGLEVLREAGAACTPTDRPDVWIHDFHTREKHGRDIALSEISELLEQTITAVLSNQCEDDPFNALVLLAGLNWREAWALRAAARHHQQTGFSFSQQYIAETLSKYPTITRELVSVFHARFNPKGSPIKDARAEEISIARERALSALDDVSSLDEDRIIRRYLQFIEAVTRTNFFQSDSNSDAKPYLSFKIDSARIDDMPEPVPYREIFVSSPRVDGVHLRFGPISRGGLRWSDRREDFRTEVLGLVKAQRVKNAVIVPTGSKGCFYPKQLPTGDRNATYEEGREAYKVFIRGMLDVTDNMVNGRIVPPANTVRHDGDDAYLVVAADKGTAAFSDTANAISDDYGFWLSDAFASGGSAGYDHKVMGITARGAWEAVKRHFRELGKDIQTEPFTVTGVGDMSGDVFGNGMLLSEQIRLIGAFDHRDIFIDPNPDPASSFAERKRLFESPGSSWQDYDKELISSGGGVFSRSAKAIPLSEEIKDLLELSEDRVTPHQLIKAILKAQTELFWLGGIGTYIKAAHEEHWKVGDRANDAIRINANDLRAQVVGEGANLGLTQEARIIVAQQGTRLNTDAIDNSAGVDSSDHEVNIKILLSAMIESSELPSKDRNDLLKEMTDDVAAHVLAHNYTQTRGISQVYRTQTDSLDADIRFMEAMELDGRLDRELENLPDRETLTQRRARKEGFNRPELSVLIAYAKNWLFDELNKSNAPDDPALEETLFSYFPNRLRGYSGSIQAHPLRREIIATKLANNLVDFCGPSCGYITTKDLGVQISELALAFEASNRIFGVREFADQIDQLDNQIDADLQLDLYNVSSTLIRTQIGQILRDHRTHETLKTSGIDGLEKAYCEDAQALCQSIAGLLPAKQAKAFQKRQKNWLERGASKEIAAQAALAPCLDLVFDIINLAKRTGWPVTKAAAVFLAVGDMLFIDGAREAARQLTQDDYYDRIALATLIDELTARQIELSELLIERSGFAPDEPESQWLHALLSDWHDASADTFTTFENFVEQMDTQERLSIAKLSILDRKLAELIETL